MHWHQLASMSSDGRSDGSCKPELLIDTLRRARNSASLRSYAAMHLLRSHVGRVLSLQSVPVGVSDHEISPGVLTASLQDLESHVCRSAFVQVTVRGRLKAPRQLVAVLTLSRQ